jgi:hypothetical protein
MSAAHQTAWQLRLQVWWFQIRVSAGQFSPMLRRWLERFDRQICPGLQGGLLNDVNTSNTIVEQLAKLQPGGLVVVPAFFVGKNTSLFSGMHTLWPFTQYFYTPESAERQHRGLAKRFPGCVVLAVAMTFDPAVPEQLANLKHVQKVLAAEILCGGR